MGCFLSTNKVKDSDFNDINDINDIKKIESVKEPEPPLKLRIEEKINNVIIFKYEKEDIKEVVKEKVVEKEVVKEVVKEDVKEDIKEDIKEKEVVKEDIKEKVVKEDIKEDVKEDIIEKVIKVVKEDIKENIKEETDELFEVVKEDLKNIKKLLNKKDELLNFDSYTFDETNDFSLKDQFLSARVVDIYDGDTITCVIPIFTNFYKFHIRLYDIDTCEMKSKEEENKKLAYKARNRMVEMITNKIVFDKDKRKEIRSLLNQHTYMVKIKCGDFDKYGRLLAWIFPYNSDLNIKVEDSFNHLLVKEKLAYFYKGDTKLTEKDQINLLN